MGKEVEKTYQELLTTLEGERRSTYDCFVKLHSLLDIVKDNHNALMGNAESFSLKEAMDSTFLEEFKKTDTYSLHPTPYLNLEKLEQELAEMPVEKIEGIYSFKEFFTIGIYKEKNEQTYKGVVLKTTIPTWQRGEQLFKMVPIGGDRFRVIYGSYVNKRLVSTFTYFKDGEFFSLNFSKKDPNPYYRVEYPDSTYLLRDIDDQVQYLKLGSFKSSSEGIKKATAFYQKIQDELVKPYLIVDLRNNGGGGQKNSKQFLKLLSKYKGKVYVLANYLTASNAEQFILRLRKKRDFTFLGDNTNGTIAYGRNYDTFLESPDKQFVISFTDMNFHHFLEYERVGIPPDQYLSLDSSWLEQTLEVIKVESTN
jgi:hypothetical protein